MSEYKLYEPPKLTIHADEYLQLMAEQTKVLENHRKLMREHAELIDKYHQLNDEYARYKIFVKPGGVSDE
jgi:UV DNA damage repair endonuclease